ncbi:hypothetical protein [Bifidobacterium avesanii]|uniref:Uncharacterized protein n=1 Tax=Bifidobacterium avesanii TaxID=1798157 RepID=A0A7K3TEE2_9BIFI|nr:hypothetical protein [Bifidobacterium avesanii]KAB8295461.1 hypothetical protein DSM100685_0071 [Bifidobacterium avesanii]NEG77467.1 hypothetical protein [Bifidobacterium avesanii]
MPWWIWLLLVLFMLVMLIAGVVYAGLRAVAALHAVAGVGEKVSAPLAAMGEQRPQPRQEQAPPFVEPLNKPYDRYVAAHAEVLRRRAKKEDRRADVWRRWAE